MTKPKTSKQPSKEDASDSHIESSVRDTTLSYIRDAITGDKNSVPGTVRSPHSVDASRLLQNFMDAKGIHWLC